MRKSNWILIMIVVICVTWGIAAEQALWADGGFGPGGVTSGDPVTKIMLDTLYFNIMALTDKIEQTPGGDIRITSDLIVEGIDCSGTANQGKITKDATGKLVCQDDVSGSGALGTLDCYSDLDGGAGNHHKSCNAGYTMTACNCYTVFCLPPPPQIVGPQCMCNNICGGARALITCCRII